MNTFFITTQDILSEKIYAKIASLDPKTWISPRGEQIQDDIITRIEIYDTDPEPPNIRNPGLIYTYVTVNEWLAEYEINSPEKLVDALRKNMDNALMNHVKNINFSPIEISVIKIALEFYSRICMGELQEIQTAYSFGKIRPIKHINSEQHQPIESACLLLKQALFPELPPHTNYGIFSQEIHKNAMTAVDAIKKIEGRFEQWQDLKKHHDI